MLSYTTWYMCLCRNMERSLRVRNWHGMNAVHFSFLPGLYNVNEDHIRFMPLGTTSMPLFPRPYLVLTAEDGIWNQGWKG